VKEDEMSTTEESAVTPNETHDWDAEAARYKELRKRFEELADRGFPAAWIKENPGDALMGIVRDIKPAVRTAYGKSPVLEIVEPETGKEWSLWLNHVVLRREVWRVQPELGEMLYVRYEGLVKPESGGPAYENWFVAVDRPEQNTEVDWKAIARSYGDDVDDDDDRDFGPGPDLGSGLPDEGKDDDIPF
jgi:hypothetical protein